MTTQAPYPDPKDAEAWNKQPTWPTALGSASNLSYDQQYKALIGIMQKVGVSTVKVTHTWRVAGAQAMDAAGVDDSVGFWHTLSFEHLYDCNDSNMLGTCFGNKSLIDFGLHSNSYYINFETPAFQLTVITHALLAYAVSWCQAAITLFLLCSRSFVAQACGCMTH